MVRRIRITMVATLFALLAAVCFLSTPSAAAEAKEKEPASTPQKGGTTNSTSSPSTNTTAPKDTMLTKIPKVTPSPNGLTKTPPPPSSPQTTAAIHVCFLTHEWSASMVSAMHFVFDLYGRETLPHLDFRFMFLGTPDAPNPAVGLAQALIPQWHNCTVTLGPGWTSLVQSLNLLIDSPLWIDYSSTSTTLAERTTYATFNRVVPSDEGVTLGVVRLLAHANWRVVNTLCSENVWARSFISGIGKYSTEFGVHLGLQRCFSTAVTEQDIDMFIASLQEAESRVVVVAGLQSLQQLLIDRLKAQDLQDAFFVVFAVCDHLWASLPGAFCPELGINETRRAAFHKDYWRRKTRDEVSTALRAAGVTEKWLPEQNHELGTFDSFAVDAAFLTLRVLESFYPPIRHPQGTLPIPRAPNVPNYTHLEGVQAAHILELLRTKAVYEEGLSGDVRLDSIGERAEATTFVFNAVLLPNGTTEQRMVATVTPGKFEAGGVPYFAGVGETRKIPSYKTPKALIQPTSSDPFTSGSVFIVMTALFGVIIMLFIVGLVTFCIRRARRMAVYPRNNHKPFAAFFISAKNEAALRDVHGADAVYAVLRRLEHMIDAAAAAERCYVARRLDAHFLVVAKTPTAALRCVSGLMRAIEAEPWGTMLTGAKVPAHIPGLSDQKDSTDRDRTNGSRTASQISSLTAIATPTNSGSKVPSTPVVTAHRPDPRLLVSVGAAFGYGRIVTNASDPFDVRYAGSPVDQAAFVTDATAPGQVLATRDLVRSVCPVPDTHTDDLSLHSEMTTTVSDVPFDFEEFATLDGLPAAEFFGVEAPADRPTVHPLSGIAPGDSTEAEGFVHPAAVYQFTPAGLPRRNFTAAATDLSEVTEDDDERHTSSVSVRPGALTAALEEASGGLATRPIAVVAILVPDLLQRRTQPGDTQLIYRAVTDAAAVEKGVVISALDAVIAVAVNVTGPPVTSAPARAAAIGLAAVAAIEESVPHCAYAGVDCGFAVVGSVGDAKSAACNAIAFRAVVAAHTAMRLSRASLDSGDVSHSHGAGPSGDGAVSDSPVSTRNSSLISTPSAPPPVRVRFHTVPAVHASDSDDRDAPVESADADVAAPVEDHPVAAPLAAPFENSDYRPRGAVSAPSTAALTTPLALDADALHRLGSAAVDVSQGMSTILSRDMRGAVARFSTTTDLASDGKTGPALSMSTVQPVVATAACTQELQFRFDLQAVELCAWPALWGAGAPGPTRIPSIRRVSAAGRSHASRASAAAASRPQLLHLVVPKGRYGRGRVEDDEWMYQVQTADAGGTFAKANVVLEAMAAGGEGRVGDAIGKMVVAGAMPMAAEGIVPVGYLQHMLLAVKAKGGDTFAAQVARYARDTTNRTMAIFPS